MSDKTCAISGCARSYRSGGLCWKHRAEAAEQGQLLRDGRRRENRASPSVVACRIEGCAKPAKYRGKRLCMAHYLRIWKHGSSDLPAPPTLSELLEEGIESREGCWIWGGPVSSSGYGRIGSLYSHRVSYEIHIGAIPDGLQIDHLCFEKLCANPAHLEAVTQEENLRRQRLRMKRRGDGTWERAAHHCQGRSA